MKNIKKGINCFFFCRIKLKQMKSLVCFSQGKQPNRYLFKDQLVSKSAQDALRLLKVNSDVLLAISTPLFRSSISPEAVLLSECPNLVFVTKESKQYPPMPYHVDIFPSNFNTPYAIFVGIKTQLPNKFPRMCVEFTKKELKSMKADDFLQRCLKIFSLQCTDTMLKWANDDPVAPTQTLENIFNQVRKENEIFFCCTISDDVVDKVKRRAQLSDEIISTENSFVTDMTKLSSYWIKQFLESKIFQDSTVYIFGGINPILKTHMNLVGEFGLLEKGYAASFGPVFLNFIDKFKTSLSFISNFKRNDEMIKKIRTSSSYNEKVFHEIEENNPDQNGRDFMSYYITPVQRYPRYLLLIRDIDKVTPSFHPDKPYLSMALESMDNANKTIDHQTYRVKQMLLMESISKTLPPSFFLMEEGRELVDQKNVKISKSKNANGILYLFNDIILLVKKGSKYDKLLTKDPIKPIAFQFSNGRPNAESIMAFIEDKDYIIHFEDYSSKQYWTEALINVRNSQVSTTYFDIVFAKWSDIDVGETLVPAMCHSGVLYNGNAIFFGGLNSQMVAINTLITYNQAEGSWTRENTDIPNRFNHSLVTWDECVYLISGQNYKTVFSDVWRLKNNKWESILSNNKLQVFGHTSVAYKNKIFIFGGKVDNKVVNTLNVLDLKDNSVSNLHFSNTPSPRYFHSALLHGTKMIIIGGMGEKHPVGDAYELDLESFEKGQTVSWKRLLKDELLARFNHQSALLQKYIFVIGGEDSQKKKLPFVCIDLATWTIKQFENIGNVPLLSITKSSLVQLDNTKFVLYGGMDSANKYPFGCEWFMYIEEGFDKSRIISATIVKNDENRRVITIESPNQSLTAEPRKSRNSDKKRQSKNKLKRLSGSDVNLISQSSKGSVFRRFSQFASSNASNEEST